MKILVIGCSDVFLRRVLPALHFLPDVTKIDIASKKKKKSIIHHSLISKIEYWFNDYEDAIRNSNADIVYISLPNHLHFYWAKFTLTNGIHCVIEKPAVLNLNDANTLNELANSNNLCLAESTIWYFHPQIEFISDKLRSFKNKSLHISASFKVPEFNNKNFRNSFDCGGGAFNDMSAYAISIGRAFFNEYPIKKKIESFKDVDKSIDTSFVINLDYENKKNIKGEFGFGFDYENFIEIKLQNEIIRLERVFSPPSNQSLYVNIISKDKNEKLSFMGDAYLIFFNQLFESIKYNNYQKWNNIFISDATNVNMLRESIKL